MNCKFDEEIYTLQEQVMMLESNLERIEETRVVMELKIANEADEGLLKHLNVQTAMIKEESNRIKQDIDLLGCEIENIEVEKHKVDDEISKEIGRAHV